MENNHRLFLFKLLGSLAECLVVNYDLAFLNIDDCLILDICIHTLACEHDICFRTLWLYHELPLVVVLLVVLCGNSKVAIQSDDCLLVKTCIVTCSLLLECRVCDNFYFYFSRFCFSFCLLLPQDAANTNMPMQRAIIIDFFIR